MHRFEITPVTIPAYNNNLHVAQPDLWLSYHIPDEAEETLHDILTPYKQDPIWYMEKISPTRQPAPWAFVFLDREYNIAHHISRARPADAGIGYAPYSEPDVATDGRSIPKVGALLFMHKQGLEKSKDKSPVFAAAWSILQNCSEEEQYLVTLDTLSKDWLSHI